MKMTHIKDLTLFRAHPATQPTVTVEREWVPVYDVPVDAEVFDTRVNEFDEEEKLIDVTMVTQSVLTQAIDSRRTNIVYNGNESLAFLADVPPLVQAAIDANPDIVDVYEFEQAFGNPTRQAVDADDNKLWTTQAGTEIQWNRVKIGTDTVIPTRKEKQMVEGWSVSQVDVTDPETGEVTGEKDVWEFSGETTTDAEGNTLYPAKYEYVDVPMPEESYEHDVYEMQPTEVPVVNKIALLDPLEPDPAVKAIYDRVYPRTPYPVTDDNDNVTMVTPPELFGFIDGHV